MSEIIHWLASVLGVLMDLFFRGFTAIGYPRLWVCVVAFAATTRFLFLPQKINTHKTKLLTPVVNYELLQVDPDFFSKVIDKEMTVKRSLLKKEVFRKYKLSNNSGCLTTLVQYPLLVALFYVVKNPQEFVPSLEAISHTFSEVNTLLGVSLSAVPLKGLSSEDVSWMIIFVPLVVMLSNFFKMLPSIKKVKRFGKFGDKLKTYSLTIFMILMLGWFSASLPLVISLYWISNDITNAVLNMIIGKVLPKTKFVSNVLREHSERVKADKEAAMQATTMQAATVSE